VDRPQQFRFQPFGPKARQQIGEPRGMVDQAGSSLWGKGVSNSSDDLLKGRGYLMFRLPCLRIRVQPPSPDLPVGGVAEDQVKGRRRKERLNSAEVALDNLHAIVQPVELCSAQGSAGQGRLHLKTDHAQQRMPISQQERDRPVSAAQIEDPIGGSRCRELRQQDGIHRMAEAFHALNNP
jgi:hypothetical protein